MQRFSGFYKSCITIMTISTNLNQVIFDIFTQITRPIWIKWFLTYLHKSQPMHANVRFMSLLCKMCHKFKRSCQWAVIGGFRPVLAFQKLDGERYHYACNTESRYKNSLSRISPSLFHTFANCLFEAMLNALLTSSSLTKMFLITSVITEESSVRSKRHQVYNL